MATFKFEVGNSFETLTQSELDHSLREAEAAWRARSLTAKWHELALPLTGAPTSYTAAGPAAGFAWKLRIVSTTLAATGTIQIYKGASANNRLIGNSGATSVTPVIFFPDDIVISSDQQVFIAASAAMTNIYIGAVQVAAERLGEILS